MALEGGSILATFLKASSETVFCDKWMRGDDLCVAISNLYDLKKDEMTIKKLTKALNTKIGKTIKNQIENSLDRPLNEDHIGIFREAYRQKKSKNRKREGTSYAFYIVSQKGSKPPSYDDPWYNHIVDFLDLAKSIVNMKKSLMINSSSEWVYASNEEANDNNTMNKRLKIDNDLNVTAIDNRNPISTPEEIDYAPATPVTPILIIKDQSKAPPQLPFQSYWHSTGAKKLFLPLATEADALVAITRQIEMLAHAMETPLSLVDILEDGDDIDIESISQYQMFYLRQKVTMLHIALNVAVKDMLHTQNWGACCEKAIEIANETIGKSGIKNERTIRNWYMQFREKRKLSSRTIIGTTKDCLPPFLHDNLDAVEKMKEHARSNLSTLSIEMMSEYVNEKVIPKIVKDKYNIDKTSSTYADTAKVMLRPYHIKTICPSTIYKWLIVLGFKYQTRRKGYYVDGHERPRTVSYRNAFVLRYLNYEQRMHRWIQVPLDESRQMEDDGKVVKNSGYRYVDAAGGEMVEYHVDTLDEFQIRMNETKFGGNLSVRKNVNEKALIIIGHDECIFKQYLLTKKVGLNLMVSWH